MAERVEALGLDFFGAYVWGRAASLGEPPAALVTATFGVFEPALIAAVYPPARAAAGRDAVLAARQEGAAASLAAIIGGGDADAVALPLRRALAGLDGMGRPLFSALRALPEPPNAPGRLWRAAELVREHRGDGHLAAAVAQGLHRRELNVLTELWLAYGLGEYSASRGMDGAQQAEALADLERRGWASGGELAPTGRAAREQLEEATDRSQDELVAALGDDLEPVIEAAERISAAIVAAKSFPSDPRKRAAG